MLPVISAVIVGSTYAIAQILENCVKNKIDESIINGSEIVKHKLIDLIGYHFKIFINKYVFNLCIIFASYTIGKLFNQTQLFISFSIIFISIRFIFALIRTLNIYIDSAKEYNTLDPASIVYQSINNVVYQNVEKENKELPFYKKILVQLFSDKNTNKISKEITDRSIKKVKITLAFRSFLLFLGFLIYILIYKKLFILTTGITFNEFWEPVLWPYNFLYSYSSLSIVYFTIFILVFTFIFCIIEFSRISTFFKLWTNHYCDAHAMPKQNLSGKASESDETMSEDKDGLYAWIESKFQFDSLADVIKCAQEKFPNRDIVPTIAIAGRTGAGKSSLINALVGRHVSSIGVIPTTQHPTPHELEGDVPLRILDLPGVGEANRHGERMDTVLAQADTAHLLLLAVPCPERSLDYESKLLSEVHRHFEGRTRLPLITVATKVDCASPARDWQPATLNLASPSTAKERNIADWLTYAASVLPGVDKLVPCACGETFDDVAGQYGIPALRRHIFDLLPDATRTYFARVTRDKELLNSRAESIVHVFTGMASAAAAQPLPAIPDSVIIMPIQMAMLMRLTTLHGRDLSADLAAELLGSLTARVAGRLTFEQVTKLIPGVGSIVGATVAGGMTYALGMGYHTLLCGGHWRFDVAAIQEEVLRWWKKAGMIAKK